MMKMSALCFSAVFACAVPVIAFAGGSYNDAATSSVLSDQDAAGQATKKQDADKEVIAYPLNTCIVADSKLGSMGDPVVKEYDGRQVKFCCAACVGTFEADKATYFKKLDELIAKDQMRYYPIDTCFIMGDPLVQDGEDYSINVVHNNRLVRLCCPMCVRRFESKPAEYLKQLDKMIVEAQRKDYPLETCIVAGSELGSMGEPVEMIVAGRLIRLCCAGCEGKVKADPAKYIAQIDKAWQKQGKFMPEKSDG